MVDGIAAARWLLSYGAVTPSMCLFYVWQAFKAQGASTGLGSDRATGAWEQSDGKHPGDRNPPAGAAVWWGRRRSDGNYDGDVVISLGGGRVAVTEAPGMGSVTGACTLDERERQINREYLGWTDHIFDCPIDNLTTTIAADAAQTSEEDDMIRIQSPGRGIALIGPGYYRPLTSDEEVNESSALISKHLSGNDRQFDLWASMARDGISATTATVRQEARPLKLYTSNGKLIVVGPNGRSWPVPDGYRALLEAMGLVGPNVIRELPDNEREFLEMILGLIGPAGDAPKA